MYKVSKEEKLGPLAYHPGVTAPGPTKKGIKQINKSKLSDERSIFPLARLNGTKTSPTGVSGCMDEWLDEWMNPSIHQWSIDRSIDRSTDPSTIHPSIHAPKWALHAATRNLKAQLHLNKKKIPRVLGNLAFQNCHASCGEAVCANELLQNAHIKRQQHKHNSTIHLLIVILNFAQKQYH